MASSLLSAAGLTPGMAILTSLGLVLLDWNPCLSVPPFSSALIPARLPFSICPSHNTAP